MAETLYAQSAASGQPINEATSNLVDKSAIYQNYIEGSNVQVVDEMVNMIVAQRIGCPVVLSTGRPSEFASILPFVPSVNWKLRSGR